MFLIFLEKFTDGNSINFQTMYENITEMDIVTIYTYIVLKLLNMKSIEMLKIKK